MCVANCSEPSPSIVMGVAQERAGLLPDTLIVLQHSATFGLIFLPA
jgi:hypothetical protein